MTSRKGKQQRNPVVLAVIAHLRHNNFEVECQRDGGQGNYSSDGRVTGYPGTEADKMDIDSMPL